MRNKLFWNTFYIKKKQLLKPSPFAKFFYKNIKKKKSTINILDCGCGNGRDTIFFLKKKIYTLGIDASEKAINNLKKNKNISNYFYNLNICKPIKKDLLQNQFNFVYARFFIHAITSKEEKFFFSNCKKWMKKNGEIYIEFRTDQDPLYKQGNKISKYEYIFGHYRRFINIGLFKKRIQKYGFKIKFMLSSFNLAKFKTENPHICRMILVKKN